LCLDDDVFWRAQPHVALVYENQSERLSLLGIDSGLVKQYMVLRIPPRSSPAAVARILAAESEAIDKDLPTGVRKTVLDCFHEDVLVLIAQHIGEDYAKDARTFNPVRLLARDMRNGVDCRHRIVQGLPTSGVVSMITRY
jgi:hypothetical protein